MIPSISLCSNKVELKVKFKYNSVAVEDIKDSIPYIGRRWDRSNYTWYIHRSFLTTVCAIMKQHFGSFSLDKSCDELFKIKQER